ncbi:class I SAM-dependent methyltransferase [Pseudomonas rustica]
MSADWEACKQEVIARFKAQPQQFGRGDLYQAHEEWGIPGQRPTQFRLYRYHAERWMPEAAKVLDIGCNIGLIGMALASSVEHYLGFDNNPLLIDIARTLAAQRRIDNCEFLALSFDEFIARNEGRTFDVVCSFAVHVWIGLPIAEYGRVLHGLLSEGGLLALESNRLETNDKDFYTHVQTILDCGFSLEYQTTLKDDGVIERGFCVLRKVAAAQPAS